MIYYDCTNDVCMAHCFSCCTVESDLLIRGAKSMIGTKYFLLILAIEYCSLVTVCCSVKDLVIRTPMKKLSCQKLILFKKI